MNLDDLLRQSADETQLPRGFLRGVQLRIQKQNMQQKKRQLLRDTVLLSGSFLVFFYALSGLMIHSLAFETLDFLSVLWKEPGVLALEEGRSAVFESIPLASLLFTVLAASLCIRFMYTLLLDIRPFSAF
ncbi:hypothetical protein COU76_01805, partial [Candidatus Peregrinibacteria bacterium CG10_big_fil_rev_8_21_14_0_10_49_10]